MAELPWDLQNPPADEAVDNKLWKFRRRVNILELPGMEPITADLLTDLNSGVPGMRIYMPGQAPKIIYSEIPNDRELPGQPSWKVFLEGKAYKDRWEGTLLRLTRRMEISAGDPNDMTLFTARDQKDGAMVAPYDEKNDSFIMIKQPRLARGDVQLLLPSGYVGDEKLGQKPYHAAVNELRQETGYRATIFDPLGVYDKDPGASMQRLHAYLARGLVKEGERKVRKEEEKIEVVSVPREQALEYIVNREIRDIQSACVIQAADRQLRKEGIIA